VREAETLGATTDTYEAWLAQGRALWPDGIEKPPFLKRTRDDCARAYADAFCPIADRQAHFAEQKRRRDALYAPDPDMRRIGEVIHPILSWGRGYGDLVACDLVGVGEGLGAIDSPESLTNAS
jgi:hypothetical protein